MHFSARLVAIGRHSHAHLDAEDMDLLDTFSRNSYNVPSQLDSYFRAIGDFKTESGHYYMLDTQRRLNINGHFGRVDTQTHELCVNYPAPYVILNTLRHELDYSEDPTNVARHFPLDLLTPQKANPRRITSDMLEHQDATRLTERMI